MAGLKDGFLPLAFSFLVALGGCAKLTEPVKDEPMQVDPPASAAANAPEKPFASASAKPAEPAEKPPEKPADPPTNEKLGIKDVVVGKGAEAKTGDNVKVHYVGTLPDGKEFDASKKHGQPFDFELGAGRVIKGWDQGLVGMKVGGRRKLTIPSDLAYGDRGMSTVIPPKSTLLFDIELLSIK